MGEPDIQNASFQFYLQGRHYGDTERFLVITDDWCKIGDLSIEEILQICDKVMYWFNLRYVNLYVNRTRMSNLTSEFWKKNKISLKYQLTGWCDVYQVEKK